MDLETTRFQSAYDLARLPWFELRDGDRVVLVDDTLGPIVDMHTHLALSYVRHDTVDIEAPGPPTRHYLPMAQPVDLEGYLNLNFSDEDLSAMRRDLTVGCLTRGGMRPTHTAPNLEREMADAGVHTALLLPIDFPWLSRNAEDYLALAAGTDRLASLGSVHPHARDVAARLDRQKAMGARGIKFHPAVQMVAPDHPKAMALYRLCAERDMLVFYHCGPVGIEAKAGRERCQLKHYWAAVADNPDVTFVLGHSGALQMERGLELAQRYPNVFLELASQGLSNVRRIVAEAPPERILFGSDWPFYPEVVTMAKVLIATDDDPGARRRILWENAARLLDLAA